MFLHRRASFALVLLAAWAGSPPCRGQAADPPTPAAAAPAPPAPATSPSAAAPATPDDRQIAEAIDQLGDGDFRIRERATRVLWGAGPAAEPALRAALDRAGPEVAGRIRTVLANIAAGLTPDMSAEVIELVGRYRAGNAGVKRQVADVLAQRGAAEVRVLLKLRDEERDPATRAGVSVVLTHRASEMAVSLIADGDAATAGRLLAAAAEAGKQPGVTDHGALLNYAAFLLVHGGLAEQIAAAQARLENFARLGGAPGIDGAAGAGNAAADAGGADGGAPRVGGPAGAGIPVAAGARGVNGAGDEIASTALLLTFLHRANGDLPAARAAAERADDDDLLRNILIELGDWKALAARAAADVNAADLQGLSFATTFHRLAGDVAGAEKFAAALRATADREPHNSEFVAEGLFLNGRVDLGLDVLTRHHRLAWAADFHTQRLAFDQIPRLLERARARDAEELRQVEAAAARALWYTGESAAAAAQLADAAKACEKRRDFEGFTAVIDVAHDIGLAEPARWYTVNALQVAVANPAAVVAADQRPDRRDLLADMFAKSRLRDGARAAAWWRLLRRRFPKEPAGHTLGTVTAIDARTMTGENLQALCDASAEFAATLAPAERGAELELIADTLAAGGRREPAAVRYREIIEVCDAVDPTRAATALSKLAAFEVNDKHWQAAADQYLQAWSRDRTQPVPLYLSGWALVQAGDASTGNQRTERAHLIALADQESRHDLFQALSERNLVDEARREQDLILKTAEFMSQPRSEALRRAGDAAYADRKATAAADLWERAFLDNNDKRTRFIERWADVSMPALVRRTRAVGLIQDGDLAAAIKEAEACMAMSPGDADSLIEIVSALDAAGHKSEADALYRSHTALYEQLASRHPQSGPLHNLCAWAAAKCKRDLDGAMAHATRAVELQPANTASLDTLAEAHFQRREFQAAITVMQRCVELEPDDPRHKEQIERFRKAEAEAKAG